jgi:hypothetical protein
MVTALTNYSLILLEISTLFIQTKVNSVLFATNSILLYCFNDYIYINIYYINIVIPGENH